MVGGGSLTTFAHTHTDTLTHTHTPQMDSHPTDPEVSGDLVAKGNVTNPEEQSEDVPFMHSGRTVVYCPGKKQNTLYPSFAQILTKLYEI